MIILISGLAHVAVTIVVVIVAFLRVVHLFRVRLRTGWSFKSYLIWIAARLDACPHDLTATNTNNFLNFFVLLNVSVYALLTLAVARAKIFESYVWF